MLQRAGPFLAGLLTGLLAAGLVWLMIAEPRGLPITLEPPPTEAPMHVHVTGAVLHPGVYTLSPGSIIQDALDAAGGALPGAVVEAVNLAAPVQPGEQIFVPQPQTPRPTPLVAPSSQSAAGVVNVNTATAPELDLLPGIGPALAQNIIDYREAHGPFASPEDLLDVPGIGPAKLEQIRDLIILR
jgi:competence protein ComEA